MNKWDEKNYIEQEKNSLSNKEHAPSASMNATGSVSTQNGWNATGSQSQMYKLCYNGETNEYLGDNKSHVVYLWTETRDGVEYPCYVGQTTKKIKTRINEHFIHPSEYLFQRKLRKNPKKYKCYILIEGEGSSQEYMNKKEYEYILLLNTFQTNNKYGYNLTLGGDNGKRSDSTKQKLSIKLKGRKFSDETRKKMSNSHLGKSPGNKGKSPSEETRKLWSTQRKGRKQSEQTKLRKSISLLNKKPVGKTGVRGVVEQKNTGKFIAFANKKYLGTYDTIPEAKQVVDKHLKYTNE